MEFTYEDISKVMLEGDRAGDFNPDAEVYSKMAVRAMIINALSHYQKKEAFQPGVSHDTESRAVLEGEDYHVNQVDAETISLTQCM